MGYYVKMQELLETGHQLVRQTEEWTKQLEAYQYRIQSQQPDHVREWLP